MVLSHSTFIALGACVHLVNRRRRRKIGSVELSDVTASATLCQDFQDSFSSGGDAEN